MRRLILALLIAGGCSAQTPAVIGTPGASGATGPAPCTTTDLIFLNTSASTPGCTSLLSFNVAGKYLNINSIRVWRGLGDIASNTAVGVDALANNTSGGSNSAFGSAACNLVTSRSFNTCAGVSAGAAVTTNSHMTAFGRQAGLLATGSGGTFVGSNAGLNTTTGAQNTMLGYNTGLGITTGEKNTVIGANVTGLTSSLSNNIILADGDGNIRAQADGNGKWAFTNQGAYRQTADLAKSNTTLAAVTGISIPLLAGTSYAVSGTLINTQTVIGGGKYQFAYSGTMATGFLVMQCTTTTGGGQVWVGSSTGLTEMNVTWGEAETGGCDVTGYYTTTTAGTLTLQYAQNSASGTSTAKTGTIVQITPTVN